MDVGHDGDGTGDTVSIGRDTPECFGLGRVFTE